MLSGLLLFLAGCSGASNSVEYQEWKILFSEENSTLTLKYDDEVLLEGLTARYKLNDDYYLSSDYDKVSVSTKNIDDEVGRGKKFTFSYTNLEGNPDLEHIFYLYDGSPFFLTEIVLISNSEISTNYLAPIYSESKNAFLDKCESNRVLTVPFDNDNFVHYYSYPLSMEDTSSEVTAIFNGHEREGIVTGSVEHDTWKTGIHYITSDNQNVELLECYGGMANELTRDVSDREDRPSCEHGSIHGKSLKSPKLFFGYFSDWRRGLESFGEVCATYAPPRAWHSGTPFGWNSWAAMAQHVNYEGAIDVSDFIKEQLQSKNFINDGVTYVGLDSFWDNFTDEQLAQYVVHCNENGQKAGIYWCPFSDWHGNGEAYVEGTDGEWQYKDIYLYAENGQPRKIESIAVDPTHPGSKKRMEHYVGMFKRLGYEYIKLDFINNGTLEAASFYNPEVTTGKQAYNEGMGYFTELCGDEMFLALSIAPTFPAQYGTSKRISCDAWGAMSEREWGSTGYMLNSLSFGWWLDRVYPFNDSDHILLYKPEEAEDHKLGANRARITSAVITGIYMLGDNFSLKGSIKGDQEARDRAVEVATNADINDIARIGKSFYPVEGYTAVGPGKSETQFMLNTEEYLYVAIFNFDKKKVMEGEIAFERLGLASGVDMSVKELWSAEYTMADNDELEYRVPPQDARVYRIQK